jgi:TonB-linked SusC/RagA family outer membrane protein
MVRKMKLTVLLVCVSALWSLAFAGYAQSAKLTVVMENATVKNILGEIEDQSEFRFFYSGQVDVERKTSVNLKDQKIFDILDEIFENTNVKYEVYGRQIALIDKSETFFDKTLTLQPEDMQQKIVSGKVTDMGGQALPGVTVVVKGTTQGTVTNADGSYSITNIPSDATLQFSFVGMKTQEVVVGSQTNINVVMEEETIGIDEVVAIGYGTVKKSDLTGSVFQVSSEMLRTQSVTKDPIQILQGKVPGLDITTGNKPGDISTPIIRGYNSINASNAPLVVVDGAPFGGRLNDINPSEIENIDVLKDASSTAIYGSRGANGVIIITTKRSKMDGKISFSYDGYGGISKSFKDFNMMDGETWANFRRTANPTQTDAELFDQIQLNILEQKQFTDWQKLMFDGTGYETDHNFSLSTSKNNMSNMIVLGYHKNQSIIDNMSYERFSARINGDIKIFDGLSAGYSTMTSHSKRDNGSNSVFSLGSTLNPVTRAFNENGEKIYYPSTYCEAYQQTNPLFDIDSENLENQSFRDRLFFNMFAEWEIISGLEFRSSLTTDWQFLEDGSYNSSTTNARLLGTNSLSYFKTTEKSVTFTNILNYKKILKDHSFDISLVHDMQRFRSDQIGLSGEDVAYYGKWYNVNEAPDIFSRSSSYGNWSLLSYMGRINYSFKGRYLLTLTGRSDGSSRLAEGHKWDFFPSAAFAWRISSESFMESIQAVSNLKLRLSWGNTGNTAINSYATQGALGKYTYIFGQSEEAAIGYLPTELANIDLGWERTEEINIGLDFGFMKNRFNGALDIYRRNTHDLLMKRSLPITSGYDNTWQNVGETRNQGIELALNSVVIDSKDFEWDLNISVAYNKNEIRELYNGKVDDPGNKWFIGQPLYVDWLYEFDGIWQLGQEAEAAVYGRKPGDVKVQDKNDSKNYDQKDMVIHNRIPKWTGGLSTSLTYKNFDFNAYAYTRLDYGEVIGVLTTEAGSSRLNHLDVDFWTPENPSNTFPKPVNSNSQPLLVQSNYAFRDLSFIRLKNVNLGYTFPTNLLRHFKAEKLRVYLAVDNPFVWTLDKFEGLDPENGKSYGDHRPLTTFLVGLNVNF